MRQKSEVYYAMYVINTAPLVIESESQIRKSEVGAGLRCDG